MYWYVLTMVNIYIILIIGLNLLIGYTNLLSIAHAGFYGIGAYLSVLALMKLHFTMLPSLLFAMIGTGIIALIIGKISIKLKGDFFVLVTLGFQMIVWAVLKNAVGLTNGPNGIRGIPHPVLWGVWKISGEKEFALMSTILVFWVIWCMKKMLETPWGRILKGIRDDEIGVMSLGKNMNSYKLQAFVIGSSIAAIAGFLFATKITYIDPSSFTIDESIVIISGVLIGGTGTIRGSIVGALFIVIVPELLRFLPGGVVANVKQILYGVIMIIMMIYRPKGLLGDYEVK